VLEVWHIWVIIGLLLWIIEIFTPGFVAGVFGTACFIVAPFAAADMSFKIQLLIFGLATAVMSLGVRPLAMKHIYRRGVKVKTNVDALVGEAGIAVEVIDNLSGMGRVKIGGEEWLAVTQDGSPVEAGTKVIVRRVEGCKLVVERAEKQ
jgi:membrane protein implicated in regulation of membrane protease activity